MRKVKTIAIGDETVTVMEMTAKHGIQALQLLPDDISLLTGPKAIANFLTNIKTIRDECIKFESGLSLDDAPLSVLPAIYDAVVELHADFFGQLRSRLAGIGG